MATASTETVKARRLNIYDVSFNFNSLITIKIGDDEDGREYTVHTDLICHYSSYFKAAFEGNLAESRQKVIVIRDTEKEIIDLFLRWLYTQTLPIWRDLFGIQQDQAHVLCTLYVFTDFADIPRLRKAAIDGYVSWLNTFPWLGCSIRTATYVYANTIDESPLRRLIVDDYFYGMDDLKDLPVVDDTDSPIPVELFRDLLSEREVGPADRKNKGCPLSAEKYYDDEIKAML